MGTVQAFEYNKLEAFGGSAVDARNDYDQQVAILYAVLGSVTYADSPRGRDIYESDLALMRAAVAEAAQRRVLLKIGLLWYLTIQGAGLYPLTPDGEPIPSPVTVLASRLVRTNSGITQSSVYYVARVRQLMSGYDIEDMWLRVLLSANLADIEPSHYHTVGPDTANWAVFMYPSTYATYAFVSSERWLETIARTWDVWKQSHPQ